MKRKYDWTVWWGSWGPKPLDWQPDLRSIAECTLQTEKQLCLRQYKEGVVDEAIKRATGLTSEHAVINAIASTFEAYRIPVTPIAEFGLTG